MSIDSSDVLTIDRSRVVRDGRRSQEHEPPRPVRLKNPLRIQIGWLAWFTGVFGVATAATLPVGIAGIGQPDAGAWVATSFVCGAISVGIALVCGLALAGVAYYLKRYDRDLFDFEQGRALVHWTYTRDEWDRFVDAEVSEAGHYTTWTAGFFAILGLLFGLLACFTGEGVEGSSLTVLLITTLGGLLFGAFCGGIAQAAALRKCRRLRRGVGETFVGKRGLYFAGEYRLWSMLGQRLTGALLNDERDPPVMTFRFRMQTNNGSTWHDVNVPVPSGQEEFAAALAMRLKSV